MPGRFSILVSVCCALAGAACASKDAGAGWATLDGGPPLVIAHRGASGYLPEHTLEAYALAIEQGADIIEPDLVVTGDGVLVARHDRFLSTTTDVADRPEFADRRRADPDPEGNGRVDWWIEDFTLAEIKRLRARQPRADRPQEFNGLYEIPTFREVLALAAYSATEAGRPVGVYPETKHPGHFQRIGLDFEAPLLAALEGFEAGPVFVQSFEPEILKRLNGKTDAKLVQLVYEETQDAGPNIPLAEIADYADGVGPSKDLILPGTGGKTDFIEKAHKKNLFVHAWTFRDDQPNKNFGRISAIVVQAESGSVEDILSALSKADLAKKPSAEDLAIAEYEVFFFNGVDGVFTDFPDTAVRARNALSAAAP